MAGSEGQNVNIDVSRATEVVTIASRAQAEKVREIMSRIGEIAKLGPDASKSVADMLGSATADGGCGIGCW